jgi:DNA polymerase I
MKKIKQTFVIIDGHAIIHRAYHALPPMTVKDGTMVNAVYGFTSMLLKVIEMLQPTHLAVSFDVSGGTFRNELFDQYKATRAPVDQDLFDQIPLVYDIVKIFDIPIYKKKGYEADDVIGSIAKKMEQEKDIQTIIVTGDKDLLQLVDEKNTKVYLLRRGMSDMELYDAVGVEKRFGFAPTLIPDFKALMGDPSDNIPGVRGVGKKTGTDLIMNIGDLDVIYDQLEKEHSNLHATFRPSVLKKLTEGKENAYMSLELATIVKDVSELNFNIQDCRMHTFDVEEVKNVFKQFEFFSLIKRIPGVAKNSTQKEEEISQKKKKKEILTIVDTNNFVSFEKKLRAAPYVSCKEMLLGDAFVKSNFEGLLFIISGKSFFVKVALLQQTEQKKVYAFFSDTKKILLGHDIKELIKVLDIFGVQVKNILFDIKIASYVINSSTRAHDIESIVQRELGESLPEKTKQSTLFGIDPTLIIEEMRYYDSLYEKYKKQLQDDENMGLFDTIEMPLIPLLAVMENNGILVDIVLMKSLSERVTKEIRNREKKIWKHAGKEFNVSSSTQLREVLFEELELPTQGIKKGKTGYSTAASELEKLREMHDIISQIESYRELEKLRNTYIDVLPRLVQKETGRIHTHFNQTVATTGRLSSSNPNLQNIPIRTPLGKEIRDAFIATPGNVLIAADYSQVELRIVASLAKDKKMLEIFKKGEDIHTATAAAINGVEIKDVTKEMRRAAKEVNFGVLYGMGSYGLASRTGIPAWQAKEFIEEYFKQFAGVKMYLEETLANAKDDGYVETLFGRRRYIPELRASNFQLRSAGERMAINMPVQGTAADLMKLAMIALHEKLSVYKREDVCMLLQVHDEVVFEVKKELAEEVAALVKDIMEHVTELRVPIDVQVHIGECWGDMK